ncbi:hypothetical protein [Streptomyces sp. NPDC001601]|uniref:hypothetical protein n=1 Tax=Streptomyces sp. NPDC001601 TaxID=3364592 RepID=UPI0036CAF65D
MGKTFADAFMSAEADALCNGEYGQVSDERVNQVSCGRRSARRLPCSGGITGEIEDSYTLILWITSTTRQTHPGVHAHLRHLRDG